jgi:hypothetical protein
VLPPTEYPAFKKFVQQQRLKNEKLLLRMIHYTARQYPDFAKASFDTPILVKALWSKAERAGDLDQKLADIRSSLYILLTNYLTHTALHNDPVQTERLLIHALSNHRAYPLYQKHQERLAATLEAELVQGAHWQLLAELHHNFYFHPATNKYQKESPVLHKANAYLDKHYLLTKLRLHTESVIRHKIHADSSLNLSLENLRFLLNTYDEPVFRLYRQLIAVLALDQSDESMMLGLKDELSKHITTLSQEDSSNMLTKLIQCAYYFYDQGHPNYLKYAFELYQLADANALLLYQGAVSHTIYINIITTASGVKAFQWVQYFVKKYESYLNADVMEDTRNLAEAICLFFAQDYKTAESTLLALQYQHITIRLQAEMLLLRVYYEMLILNQTDEEAFDLCVQRLRQYLAYGSADLSEARLAALRCFIQCMNDLKKYHHFKQTHRKASDRAAQKDRLLAAFKTYNQIFSRGWLYEKIANL